MVLATIGTDKFKGFSDMSIKTFYFKEKELEMFK